MKKLIPLLILPLTGCASQAIDPEEVVTLTIMAEARNQGQEGMRYVGQSILLRSKTRNLTPDQVCKEPLQYSCWNGRGPEAKILLEDPEITNQAQAIAAFVCAGVDVAPGNYDHYINPEKCDPKWARNPKASKVIGDHLFLEL